MAVASAEPNQAGKLLTLGKELLESSKYFHFFFPGHALYHPRKKKCYLKSGLMFSFDYSFFSSSRFTDSKRYEANFEKCFSLDEHRSGEICNACVLLVKRYMKLPAGSTRHWNHVVDARSGPGIKSMVKSKKKDQDNMNETPEKINKKHFYKSKRKQQTVRQRNPSIPVSGFLDMSRWTK